MDLQSPSVPNYMNRSVQSSNLRGKVTEFYIPAIWSCIKEGVEQQDSQKLQASPPPEFAKSKRMQIAVPVNSWNLSPTNIKCYTVLINEDAVRILKQWVQLIEFTVLPHFSKTFKTEID